MATADETLAPRLSSGEESRALGRQWRGLTRVATLVAVLTSPAVFALLHLKLGWSIHWSLIFTFVAIVAFRGIVDLLLRRAIPWPSLFGAEEARLQEEDVVGRRRAWYWYKWARLAGRIGFLITVVWVIRMVKDDSYVTWWGTASLTGHKIVHYANNPQVLSYAIIIVPLFLVNFLILFGPMMAMGISQMQAFEPGDAEWGVRLEDVRGQAEAKQDVRRVVNLWQSGEAFEKAGGKRERGLLFLGAPGTGKTMLSKAIATGFNSPFLSMPGSGFAQTFIGMDVVIVRYMAFKAKKLARKWGGQCIIFIDEIDAVGRRRSGVGGETGFMTPKAGIDSFEDYCFYGPNGSLTPSGDLVLETRAWRERLFAQRAERPPINSVLARLGALVNQVGGVGMMGGQGQGGLNQLLVVMDGIDNPPFMKRFYTNRINTFLDATYVIPRKIGKVSLRIPPPRPRGDQIYFIGATNVPLEVLDPALTRPGRMGRHIWFRTPTQRDRLDVFDLYIRKVAHEPDLDSPERRDELARITNGYAQPLDAKLMTPDGWRLMRDIAVGDEVVGAEGKPVRVVGVHPRGTMDAFRVAFNDGTATECTEDHLWTVEALDPRMSSRTLTLGEIVERGLRWSARGSAFYVPGHGPIEFNSSSELPINPYLLGLLLGDGGFLHPTPDFCTADEELLESVQELLPAGVSSTRHGRMNWRLSGGSRKGIPRSQPNVLTEQLREVGLCGLSSLEKFVPTAYKRAAPADRLSILQGLMDTDGSLDYRRGRSATFYSHSPQLTNDVASLVRSLGGSARVGVKGGGWRVAVDLPERQVPFRLARKAEEYRSARRPFRKRILSVDRVGSKPVQCITVDADDGLYVTDDFIVTHNSPAMIEQVCSMALTYAHHEGRPEFGWEDIVEAMTTVESGTAINIDYVPEETRAVAIHEAGHAVAGHVYMKGAESTRLSIRRRGAALGHHQALEKEERFSSWRSEEMARLIWTLGAMAAERVFYGENSTGVGGDVQSATARAAWMVGACAMAPEPIQLNGNLRTAVKKDEAREKIMKRFEQIGAQIMNTGGGHGPFSHDPISGVLGDRSKRAMVAQMLGQAYLSAHHLIEHNKDKVEKIADVVIERKELHGNELLALLNNAKLELPTVDLTKDEAWPAIT